MVAAWKNQNGQGVVESLLALPLVILAFSSILFLCYRSVVYYCADFYLHEALLCADDGKIGDCESILHQQISKILLTQNEKNISVSRSGNKVQGRLEIRFPFIAKNFGPPLVIEKQLRLPLRSGSSWKPF
ncbi:hypothetical protein [Bdellovibrio svalbardensis]|uniref:Pilus assembly protein n=1 Tax=Bdellovibrio svalbardensis TaxID=2972972 RepID=A0ABT6DF41_9BACT|nr:hypothetical protein [Bdellovibrio svalbardensis]MDG0815459.1 hypothetical protein [Bdellovibrio svalbardensis]